MPKKTTKKKTSTRKSLSKPVYLREVQIRFKKKRVKNGSPVGTAVTHSQQVYDLFQDLQNETKEKLIIISLDAQLKIMCFEVVAIGSLNRLAIRPIDILRGVIHVAPYAVILVHNHPGGNPTPSPSDKRFTKKIQKHVSDLGVYLLDHVIIGDGSHFSFVDADLLDEVILS